MHCNKSGVSSEYGACFYSEVIWNLFKSTLTYIKSFSIKILPGVNFTSNQRLKIN